LWRTIGHPPLYLRVSWGDKFGGLATQSFDLCRVQMVWGVRA
jgi:hypothetical protein